MIGTGPTNGMAVDTPGLIIASTDSLAADVIGEAKPESMTIKGIDLIEAEKIFSKAAYGKSDVMVDKEKFKDIHGQ